MASRRSRNSYIRSRRRVTLQPMGQPSRILNPAMDFRAFVTIGFWPVMPARSESAFSSTFLSATASPIPMLRVILVIRGIAITLE